MNIFVGCSSSNDIPEKYFEDCQEYLMGLFNDDNNLIFGANDTGIMGLAYETALEKQRKILGICPLVYKDNLNNLECDKEITETVNDRTNMLLKKSDAMIFLPGGMGTLCELLVALESKRGGEFDKPIIIYNSCHFYDDLLKFFDGLYSEKFAFDELKNNYHVSDSIDDTLSYLERYYKEEQETVVKKLTNVKE